MADRNPKLNPTVGDMLRERAALRERGIVPETRGPVGPRPIYEIARDVVRTWRRKDGTSAINYGAVPYLTAMHELETIGDAYGLDSGKSIVLYFLSNANSFRGPDARRIKAELKMLLARPLADSVSLPWSTRE